MTIPFHHRHPAERHAAFPHFWELCGQPAMPSWLLRKTGAASQKRPTDELGFQYVRPFHAGCWTMPRASAPKRQYGQRAERISFFNIDSIYDFLLSIA